MNRLTSLTLAALLLTSALCANGQQASQPQVAPANASKGLEYSLETIAIDSLERNVVYRTHDHIEAPNWSCDGKYLLFNCKGGIFKLPITGDEKTVAVPSSTPQLLDTGIAKKCNNDHGISFDGTQLAVSSRTASNRSQIYVVPIDGGTARLITPLSPSYWHGWSPDGKQEGGVCQRRKTGSAGLGTAGHAQAKPPQAGSSAGGFPPANRHHQRASGNS